MTVNFDAAGWPVVNGGGGVGRHVRHRTDVCACAASERSLQMHPSNAQHYRQPALGGNVRNLPPVPMGVAIPIAPRLNPATIPSAIPISPSVNATDISTTTTTAVTATSATAAVAIANATDPSARTVPGSEEVDLVGADELVASDAQLARELHEREVKADLERSRATLHF